MPADRYSLPWHFWPSVAVGLFVGTVVGNLLAEVLKAWWRAG